MQYGILNSLQNNLKSNSKPSYDRKKSSHFWLGLLPPPPFFFLGGGVSPSDLCSNCMYSQRTGFREGI